MKKTNKELKRLTKELELILKRANTLKHNIYILHVQIKDMETEIISLKGENNGIQNNKKV